MLLEIEDDQLVDSPVFAISTLEEAVISWQQQHQIHKTLNMAYEGVSRSFIAKTYAETRPSYRVMWHNDEQVAAHLAIHFDQLLFSQHCVEVACLGLWASLPKGGATLVLKSALEFLKRTTDYKIAIGRTSHTALLEHVIPKFTDFVVDTRISGKTKQSKHDEKTVVFNLAMTDDEFSALVNKIKMNENIQVETEPF